MIGAAEHEIGCVMAPYSRPTNSSLRVWDKKPEERKSRKNFQKQRPRLANAGGAENAPVLKTLATGSPHMG